MPAKARDHNPTIGDNIRTRRNARGWSVRYAADRAGLSASTWSRIERGLRSADNRYVLADIAKALECSVVDLAGQPSPHGDPALIVAHSRVIDLRGVLMDTALDEPVTTRQPRTLDQVEAELALVRDLYRRCDYGAVSTFLPPLLADLHAHAVNGNEKARALRHLVYLTHAAALVLRDLGYPTDSWLAAERCREIAEELESPVALAVAGFSRSIAASGCTGHQRAASIATRASDDLDRYVGQPNALEMAGMLHLCCALSSLGIKRSEDATSRLVAAEDLAVQTGETSTFDMFFGPTNVTFWKVSLEVDAGDPGRAVELAQGARPAMVNSPGRQVSFYLDVARGLARLNRDREAVRYLLTAERIAPQRVRSGPLVLETIRGLLSRAPRGATGAEVRGLAERAGLLV